MMTLLTATDCEAWLPQIITGSTLPLLDDAIAQAQGLADAYTHRRLGLAQHTRTWSIARGTQALALGEWPVVVDESVGYDFTVTLYPDSVSSTVMSSDDYVLEAESGLLWRRGRVEWPAGTAVVQVQWWAGYTAQTLPADLRRALIGLTGWLVTTRGSTGIRSESVDGYSMEQEPIVGGVPQSIAAILDAHRRLSLG